MKRFAIFAAALLAVACTTQPEVEPARTTTETRAPDKPTQSINSAVSGDRKNNTQPSDKR